MPGPAQVRALASDLLAAEGTRLAHVHTAGLVADRISLLFNSEDAELLVAAATLHDIGNSARIAHTGFHPLDGAVFLRAQGYPERLARLVAHHSPAMLTAPAHGIDDLCEQFPREDRLLADALAYADMHSAPDGRLILAERRLADIAHRHPDPTEAERAQKLRAALARIGTALIAAGLDNPHPKGDALQAWRSHPTR
ncbi:MAG: HD domain-containing protein [Candidatus Nanopelagicales bacterium]